MLRTIISMLYLLLSSSLYVGCHSPAVEAQLNATDQQGSELQDTVDNDCQIENFINLANMIADDSEDVDKAVVDAGLAAFQTVCNSYSDEKHLAYLRGLKTQT